MRRNYATSSRLRCNWMKGLGIPSWQQVSFANGEKKSDNDEEAQATHTGRGGLEPDAGRHRLSRPHKYLLEEAIEGGFIDKSLFCDGTRSVEMPKEMGPECSPLPAPDATMPMLPAPPCDPGNAAWGCPSPGPGQWPLAGALPRPWEAWLRHPVRGGESLVFGRCCRLLPGPAQPGHGRCCVQGKSGRGRAPAVAPASPCDRCLMALEGGGVWSG